MDKTQFAYYLDKTRGIEIQHWLAKHAIRRSVPTRFAILDDENDMGTLVSHLIQTNGERGLTMADAERAIQMLDEQYRC